MTRPLQIRLALVLALAIVAFGVLSPMRVMTGSQDLAVHLKIVDREFLALEAGQWPPRLDVAASDHHGYGYPIFQFYAPLFHTAAALLMAASPRFDAYTAVCAVLWLSFVAGGAFMFLAGRRLTGQDGAAALGALVFVTVPYALINLHARGALTELVAQMLIPACIWLTLRLADRPCYPGFAAATAAWAALLLTHTITLVFFCPAFGLFLAVYAAAARRRPLPLALALLPLPVAVLASLWFMAPVIFYPVAIKGTFGYFNYEATSYLNLWRLLAPASLTDPNYVGTAGLNPALGLPSMLCFVAVLTALTRGGDRRVPRRIGAAAAAAALVFAATAYIVKMPPPFFLEMPPAFFMMQYPYRMLAQSAWAGGLMAAGAAALLFRGRVGTVHVLTGGCLCLMAAASWIAPQPGPKDGLERLLSTEFSNRDYLPVVDRIGSADERTLAFRPLSCRVAGTRWTCPVAPAQAGQPVVLPVLFYPGLIEVQTDGGRLPAVGVPVGGYLLTGVEAAPASGDLRVRFTGAARADRISLAVLAGLGLAGLAFAGRALVRRRPGEAAAALLAAALPLLPLAGTVAGSGPGLERHVGITDWSYLLEARLTPFAPPLAPPPVPPVRWPVLSANWTGQDRILIFAEPVAGQPGRARIGIDYFYHFTEFTPPVAFDPAGTRPTALRLAIVSKPDGAVLTLSVDGAVLLERRTDPLPVETAAVTAAGVNEFRSYPDMAPRFPGTLTVDTRRLDGSPLVSGFLRPLPIRPEGLFRQP